MATVNPASLTISDLPCQWNLQHRSQDDVVVYIHGFGSSMHSSKAVTIESALTSRGYSFLRFTFDDMQAPFFFGLTVPRMVQQLRNIVESLHRCYQRVHLIGSSLGAMVLVRYVEGGASPAVRSLTTLAGSFDFYANRMASMGAEGVQQWRQEGSMSFYHYGADAWLPLGIDFLQDVEAYTPYTLQTHLPLLLIHGQQDETVEWQQSQRMHEALPHSHLQLYPRGDHSLMGEISAIISDIAAHLLPLSQSNSDSVSDCVHSPAVRRIIEEELS
ncbi:alpha/beta hydrolase [Desulfurispira natronophila]|uniref:Uncharacterized protein n=1 Tax=Desulfurispira natronophila TaxID=682562 RepID=A0A7W8DG71_9BACT|nr:alpha/beta hydrolase [Desulfurispira natronophila]MBB5021105.1 hypothetical protein [Desulfurispira natronophila]